MGVKNIKKLEKKEQVYVNMLKNHAGEWIALNETKDEIVAHGKTLEELTTSIDSTKKLILKKVLPLDVAIIP